MLRFKKYLAFLMTLVMSLGLCASASASTTDSQTFSLTIDGVTYQWEETADVNGDKKVTVTGNGEITTVTNDGEALHVNTESIKTRSIKNYIIELDNETATVPSTRATASKRSLYWNYYYYYNTNPASSTGGMYWSLESGKDNGSMTFYDYKNSTVRDLSYDFCSSVRSLDTAQWAASAASGASGGSIAAAIATAGPTAGVGAIIGIVAAIIAGGVAVAEWVSAYNCSLDCNDYFVRIKQAK